MVAIKMEDEVSKLGLLRIELLEEANLLKKEKEMMKILRILSISKSK